MSNKALLCGINNYKSFGGLNGCINDVNHMFTLLTEVFNFEPFNIHRLINEQVTKEKINKEWKWLAEDVQQKDNLIFHFSGHGSYIPDESGDELDRRDEIICLYNMDFNDVNTFFYDDEWDNLVQQIPEGVQLTIIMDTCYSGTGTKDIEIKNAQGQLQKVLMDVPTTYQRKRQLLAKEPVHSSLLYEKSKRQNITTLLENEGSDLQNPINHNVVRARFLPPPPDLSMRHLSVRATRSKKRQAEMLNYLLLTASRDDQTAADAYIDNDFNGAFTYYLYTTLKESPDLGSKDLIKAVANKLEEQRFMQIPQHEGQVRNGPIFSQQTQGRNSVTLPSTVSNVPIPENQQLIEAYIKLLDIIAGSQSSSRVLPGRITGNRYLVYVHGISQHRSGYSNGWWQALQPYIGTIFEDGKLGDSRWEVLWSDLVNSRDLADRFDITSKDQLRREIIYVLEDRQRQETAVNTGGGSQIRRAKQTSYIERDNIPVTLDKLFFIDDFLIYMLNDSMRQLIINRFTNTVRPLLRSNNQIDIISHSWGTVIAYEGLRELESDQSLQGDVSNFFTVGSALSIGPVRASLRPGNKDGRRPSIVNTWINLDAKGDHVGGMLGDMFEVTKENLGLNPTGCSLEWLGYSLVCAHNSYFDKDNTTVNQDIFAKYIQA
ncbi:caspase family protein [Nostoc sp. LEGE 12450]|uniref:caspase family protein n=1 Tax=Nostoc sp. LEGE 12450 TaxID=1828643 RepID=UPI00187DECB9|nr:caspase family protein [Nostoc sp. LEGE 12450]MBE8989911.1 caspase family protein [Nostoc sp. LEGE 12450]